MRLLIIFFCIFYTKYSLANFDPEDILAIKKMAGCYQVRSIFREHESFDPSCLKSSKVFENHSFELIIATENEDISKIHLQHILVIGEHAIKHWRQTWEYSSDFLFEFKGEKTWTKKEIPKGSHWFQKIYNVDDSPEYQSFGMWHHDLEKKESTWSSKVLSPVPRREHSYREDYHFLERNHFYRITNNQWQNIESNLKIVKTNDESLNPIASEKGENIYTRIDDSNCGLALKWWQENQEKWQEVYDAWEDIQIARDNIVMKDLPMRSLFLETNSIIISNSRENIRSLVLLLIENWLEPL